MNPVLPNLPSLHIAVWNITVIGALVAGLTFLVGRRWLFSRGRQARVEAPPVEEAVPTKERERRTAPRREGNRVEVYLTDGSEEPPVLAWVRDRSMGGLCLVVDQPMATELVLKVRPRTAQPTAPWLPIKVCYCRVHKRYSPDGDNQWELGCKFVNLPGWNELLLFG